MRAGTVSCFRLGSACGVASSMCMLHPHAIQSSILLQWPCSPLPLNDAILYADLHLLVVCSTGNPPPKRNGRSVDYSHGAAGATWRVTFALLIPLVLYVIYYRIYVLKELSTLKEAKTKAAVKGRALPPPLPQPPATFPHGICAAHLHCSVMYSLMLGLAGLTGRHCRWREFCA